MATFWALASEGVRKPFQEFGAVKPSEMITGVSETSRTWP